MQEKLAESLEVTQQVISKRLKAMGMIHKQGNWVPYRLKSETPILQHVNGRSNVAKSVKTYLKTLKAVCKKIDLW